MTAFNALRDRLLLRLLSQPTRNALFHVVFNDLPSEINHFVSSNDPEHIAPSLTHLADLMEEQAQWTAQLTETF
jgi:hypothetical protein